MTLEESVLEKIEALVKKSKEAGPNSNYYPEGEITALLDSIENYANDKYLMGKKGRENNSRIGDYL